jgi:hypothetical protein
MKVLTSLQRPEPVSAPSRDTMPPPNAPWREFEVPQVAHVDAPGMLLAEQILACVLSEAASLGLSLQGTQALVAAAFGSAGQSLSIDDLLDQLRPHAVFWSQPGQMRS